MGGGHLGLQHCTALLPTTLHTACCMLCRDTVIRACDYGCSGYLGLMVLDTLPLVISANSSQRCEYCLHVVARPNYLLYSHLMSRCRALLSPSATVLEATQVYSPAEARPTSCIVDIVDIIVDIVDIIVDIVDIIVDIIILYLSTCSTRVRLPRMTPPFTSSDTRLPCSQHLSYVWT